MRTFFTAILIVCAISHVVRKDKFNFESLGGGDGVNFPQKGQRVHVHYTGTLKSNGQKFDSSVDRGQPFVFTLGQGQVIKCWDKGIAMLSLGQKAMLTCPSDMAYGDRGAGGRIPPGATLMFEVELLKFE